MSLLGQNDIIPQQGQTIHAARQPGKMGIIIQRPGNSDEYRADLIQRKAG
ncbi:hypothetical protein D1AOALGA4SA_6006 [Olavius algarvensis Delta 1 endosymbiont]|nr:hypothetical protein D1AOALGA4SA_6006 [Olavius algarvensis Delta 1 endosymbiont]